MGDLLLSNRQYLEARIEKVIPTVTKGYLSFELLCIENFVEDKNAVLVFVDLINELVLVKAKYLL